VLKNLLIRLEKPKTVSGCFNAFVSVLLADRTNTSGRAYATVLRPPSVCNVMIIFISPIKRQQTTYTHR